jgi:phosphonate transport system ATP-binding protein
MPEPAIVFENVTLRYPNGYEGLKNVSLTFEQGEFVVVVGLSGAGKSTLIRCVNRLITPTEGHIYVAGREITGLGENELRKARAQIGMIFQHSNLVRRASVLRNVLAGRLAHLSAWRTLLGMFPAEDIELALSNLDRVGILDKAYQRADKLSGGQQQRVAIARALTQKPSVLLADEPVAALDPPTAHQVMRDLKNLAREENLTALVNLHFIDMAQEYADRIIGLRAGELVYNGPAKGMTQQSFEEIYGRSIRPDDIVSAAGDAIEETDKTEEPHATSVEAVAAHVDV